MVPKPIIIAERLQFHKRIQQPVENIATYLASLKELAETCDYNTFLNEALRDQLVCGLRSEAIQLTEAELDLKKVSEISQAMEATSKQTIKLQGATLFDTYYVINKNSKQGTRPCYCCGGKHSPNDCRFKDQRCKKGSKRGHIAKIYHSDNGTNSRKATKKVQYVVDGAPVDIHDSFVNDDDIHMFAYHTF